MTRGCVGLRRVGRGAIRRDRFVPHAEAGEDVRGHVQGVRNPRRDRGIRFGCRQAARCERGIIVTVDEIVRGAGMIAVCRPQFFQNRGRLQLVRQSRVSRRGIPNGQDRQRVEDARFKIVGIAVVQFAHRFFVRDHAIARSHWTVAGLSGRGGGRPIRRVVIGVESRNETPFAIGSGLHCHCLGHGCLAGAHFVRPGRGPDRVPPRHGDSPLCHRAVGILLGDGGEDPARLFVEKRMQQRAPRD